MRIALDATPLVGFDRGIRRYFDELAAALARTSGEDEILPLSDQAASRQGFSARWTRRWWSVACD